jgi:hypothetical protein
MIDYYLKKYCMLGKNKSKPRCNGCIWNDKSIHKCIFSLDYPKQISLKEMKERMSKINPEQQNNLSNPERRFIVSKLDLERFL